MKEENDKNEMKKEIQSKRTKISQKIYQKQINIIL